MASSAIHGLKGKVYMNASSAATIGAGDLVAEVRDVTLRFRSGVVSVLNRTTSEDANGVIWDEFIYGANEWSGSMEINHVPAAVTSGVFHTAFRLQNKLYALFVTEVAAGSPQWSGQIIVEEASITMPTTAQTSDGISFRGGGILTQGLQAT